MDGDDFAAGSLKCSKKMPGLYLVDGQGDLFTRQEKDVRF
jgi:hypothetical protein